VPGGDGIIHCRTKGDVTSKEEIRGRENISRDCASQRFVFKKRRGDKGLRGGDRVLKSKKPDNRNQLGGRKKKKTLLIFMGQEKGKNPKERGGSQK